ncbi:hypothetical protein ACE10Z_15360 [Bradyrhizobium sp. Pha-3]|uniref:hypothetical protein n=1 Tax=Bradyrhizobium sp. Pha-3 TaxID=208375 RepID=UPI0035D463D1
MEHVDAFSFLFGLCDRDVRPCDRWHLHGRYNQHRLIAHHGQAVPSGAFTRGQPRIAVPGWTDEDTERWLDNASSSWSQA